MKKCFSRRRVWIGDASVRHGDRGVSAEFFLGVGVRSRSGGSGPAW